jgi:uncharacterized Zn-binding protein involved in type VI secretion
VLSSTSAGVRSWVAQAEGGEAAATWTYSAQAPTSGGITGAVGTWYRVDASGLTGARTLTLPTASAGDRIAVEIAVAAPATAGRELVIAAAAGATVNGLAAGVEWSRIWQAGELIVAHCTASNSWVVEHDGRRPQSAMLALDADITTNTSGVVKPTKFDSIQSQAGALVDLGDTKSTVTVRRDGKYFVTIAGKPAATLTASSSFSLVATLNGDFSTGQTRMYTFALAPASTAAISLIASRQMVLTVGDVLQHNFASSLNNIGLDGLSPGVYAYLSVIEVL